ncbi:MAG: aspartate ammonia-lyase [Ignavibacterium sp.]|jgi:aspartate ammonia-lyase|uniref:aspartate ammonia-lyase n=1 Tax=Ignavibacterium sp. TaxID=2651167 RepID=UPI003296F3C9
MRTEKDIFGLVQLPDETLYGIHTYRAIKNFPSSGEKINPYLIKAYLQVKLAAAETNYRVGILGQDKYKFIVEGIERLIDETNDAIEGKSLLIYDKIIVDPYQGGAGTSLNMNINEVIANTALALSGRNYGEYNFIHPIDDINLSQSTNDTYPTAFKIASIVLLRELTEAFANLQTELQKKENEFSNIIKLARTQLQDAVPITLGQEFGAFAQAIARDRWRLYNGEERLRSVNLGGTAVGNSISANRDYVLQVNSELNKITGLPIAKAEDLIEATQNLDVFVEVHGLVKAGATSIIKICNDIRFLSSGPFGGIGEIVLPEMQAGSSIMPGKVNPVITEHTIQIAELVKGHDVVITNLVGSGNLELNAFLPAISHLFLKSLILLRDALYNLSEKCIKGIKANKVRCRENLLKSSALAAILVNEFGYDKISEWVKEAYKNNVAFISFLKEKNLIDEQKLNEIINREIGVNIE